MTITTYNLAPIFKWQFTDNKGKALVGGKIFTKRSTRKQDDKPVYQDAGGRFPYPNPITLDGVGSVGPIYWASDENYFVRVTDATEKNTIFVVNNYNAASSGGSGPIVTEVDYKNYIINSQFRIQNFRSITSFNPDTYTQIAPPNWYFYVDSANTTNKIEFLEFDPSLSPEEGGQPRFYLKFSCTDTGGGGESKKDIVYRFKDVKEFNNTPISIFFQASSNSNSTIELYSRQYFGTGGGPTATVETLLATYLLSPTLSRIGTTGLIIPNISGSTLGDNEDDYLEIVLRMPLNTLCDIELTSIQLNYGNLDIAYEYETYDSGAVETKSIWELPIPSRNIVDDIDFAPTRQEDGGFLFSGATVPVGAVISWFTGTLPRGWVELNGGRYTKGYYPRLYSVLGQAYGVDYYQENGRTTSVTNNEVIFEMYSNGLCLNPITDVSTGFTIETLRFGDANNTQETKITCNAAATLKSGDYLQIYSQQTYTGVTNVIFMVDGFMPLSYYSYNSMNTVFVFVNSSDSADIVAQKLGAAINPLYFYLPFTNGYYLRARDGGAGVDPDKDSRFSQRGGPSGDNVGSYQNDEFKSHVHNNTVFRVQQYVSAAITTPGGTFACIQDQPSEAAGGSETRGKNIYCIYIMKT